MLAHRFAALAVFLFALPANAAPILDFESLRIDDATVHTIPTVATYVEDGFRITATHPILGNIPRLRIAGTLAPQFAGSTALYHGNSLGIITFTSLDGAPFDLLSIELAEHPGLDASGQPVNLGPFDVAFVGTLADGSTVTNTFTVDSFLTLEPHTFTGFTNLLSVQWSQGPGGPSGPTHQFDNITIGQAIPEPSGVVFGALLVVVCWTSRRR